MSDVDDKNPSPPKKTPDEEHKRFIDEKLKLVKNSIEFCIKRYMSKQEAMDTLSRVKDIKPGVTELVWEKLETDNPEFFRAYNIRLILIDQIKEFNRMLLQQAELMESSASVSPDDASHASSNSSQQHIFNVIPAQTNRAMIRDDMQQSNFHHYGSPIKSSVQGTLNQYVHNRAIDASRSLFLSHNPNAGMAQPMNGNHAEAGYAGGSSLSFCPPVSFLESQHAMSDASLTPFRSIESKGQHPDGFISDWNSILLEQIQQTGDPESFARNIGLGPTSGSLRNPYFGQ